MVRDAKLDKHCIPACNDYVFTNEEGGGGGGGGGGGDRHLSTICFTDVKLLVLPLK